MTHYKEDLTVKKREDTETEKNGESGLTHKRILRLENDLTTITIKGDPKYIPRFNTGEKIQVMLMNLQTYKKTKATLVRAKYDGQSDYIKIILRDGVKRHLYHGLVVHSAKVLSPNERKEAIADCEEQIDNLKGENCPMAFREMLNELKYGK